MTHQRRYLSTIPPKTSSENRPLPRTMIWGSAIQYDTVDSVNPTVHRKNLAIPSVIGLKAYEALLGK